MAIDSAQQLRQARFYYFLWLIPFYAMAIWVGTHARVLLPELMQISELATEQALPRLAIDLLPDVLIGVMLAALFSATMSTADSQIIACTSAVTQDIFRSRWADSYALLKLTTFVVTLGALAIAVFSGEGVFNLVLDAWAVLTCTLGPLMLITLFNLPYSQLSGGIMIAVGFTVTNLWLTSDYSESTYVNFPGMVAVFATYLLLFGLHRLGWNADRGERPVEAREQDGGARFPWIRHRPLKRRRCERLPL